MRRLLLAAFGALSAASCASAAPAEQKPYIVLVHGAFADASSWNGVTRILQKDGFFVIAAANPLRGVRTDADAIANLVSKLRAPVVLVGHSYGGSVISEAAENRPNVKALVYVSAFAPEKGESAAELAGKFPGSTLGPALAPPVPLPWDGKDLYIIQGKFPAQFAADVPLAEARLMAVNQRPVTDAALHERSTAPAWKHIPSWWVYGDQDKNIPPRAMAFMSTRAHARKSIVIPGGSHVVMVSHPATVAKLIEDAAR